MDYLPVDSTGLKICDECGTAFYDWLGDTCVCEDCVHVVKFCVHPSGTGDTCLKRPPKLM